MTVQAKKFSSGCIGQPRTYIGPQMSPPSSPEPPFGIDPKRVMSLTTGHSAQPSNADRRASDDVQGSSRSCPGDGFHTVNIPGRSSFCYSDLVIPQSEPSAQLSRPSAPVKINNPPSVPILAKSGLRKAELPLPQLGAGRVGKWPRAEGRITMSGYPSLSSPFSSSPTASCKRLGTKPDLRYSRATGCASGTGSTLDWRPKVYSEVLPATKHVGFASRDPFTDGCLQPAHMSPCDITFQPTRPCEHNGGSEASDRLITRDLGNPRPPGTTNNSAAASRTHTSRTDRLQISPALVLPNNAASAPLSALTASFRKPEQRMGGGGAAPDAVVGALGAAATPAALPRSQLTQALRGNPSPTAGEGAQQEAGRRRLEMQAAHAQQAQHNAALLGQQSGGFFQDGMALGPLQKGQRSMDDAPPAPGDPARAQETAGQCGLMSLYLGHALDLASAELRGVHAGSLHPVANPALPSLPAPYLVASGAVGHDTDSHGVNYFDGDVDGDGVSSPDNFYSPLILNGGNLEQFRKFTTKELCRRLPSINASSRRAAPPRAAALPRTSQRSWLCWSVQESLEGRRPSVQWSLSRDSKDSGNAVTTERVEGADAFASEMDGYWFGTAPGVPQVLMR